MRDADRRAIRLGVASVILVSIARLTVMPAYESWAADRIELQRERRLLGEELGLLEWSSKSPREVTAVARALHEQLQGLFQGSDLNLISADVEDYVRAGAEAAHVTVLQFRIEQKTTVRRIEALHGLNIEVSARADYNALLRWLQLLESDARLFDVTQLEVRTLNDPAIAFGSEQLLQITVRVRAYALDPRDDYSSAALQQRAAAAVANTRRKAGE